MMDAGIFDGDLVVVEKAAERAERGDIVRRHRRQPVHVEASRSRQWALHTARRKQGLCADSSRRHAGNFRRDGRVSCASCKAPLGQPTTRLRPAALAVYRLRSALRQHAVRATATVVSAQTPIENRERHPRMNGRPVVLGHRGAQPFSHTSDAGGGIRFHEHDHELLAAEARHEVGCGRTCALRSLAIARNAAVAPRHANSDRSPS